MSPCKRVIYKYKTLLAEMVEDNVEFQDLQTNFDPLFNIVVLLGLVGLFPLLQIIHVLIKFSWQRDIFFLLYFASIKMCDHQFYGLYKYDVMIYFVFNTFKDFKDVLSCKHDIIYLWWITYELDLNNVCVEFLVFKW